MILFKKVNLENSMICSFIKKGQFNQNLKFNLHTSLINGNKNKSLFSLAKRNIYNKKNDDLSINKP